MTKTPFRTRWIPLLALVSLVAACGDSTEPLPDYDPFDSLERLDAVLEPLDLGYDAFDGLWLATSALYAYDTQGLSYALRASGEAVLRRSLPEAEMLREMAEQRRTLLAEQPSGSTLPRLTLPGAVVGRTMVWDQVAQDYRVDTSRTGAPANGVRFIYYATDSQGWPSSPLTPLGYIDLTDEDRSLAERVGVRIVEFGATPTQDIERADYYVGFSSSGSESAGTWEFESAGAVGDEVEALEFDLVQRFTWNSSEDFDRLEADYRFTTDRGPVTFEIFAESGFEADFWQTILVDVVMGTGSEAVQVDVNIDANSRLTGGILLGGQTVISISGTDGDPQFQRQRGDPLTSTEISTLEQIWIGINDVLGLVEWLIYPAHILVLDG